MKIITTISLIVVLLSCQSAEEIPVELPEFEEILAVECYLQDGEIPRAFLTQSVGYFENKPIAVDGAIFEITAPDRIFKLKNEIKQDKEYPKYYNYVGEDTLQISAGDILKIDVEDKDGRKIKGTARALSSVKIDSVSYHYNSEGFAFPVIHFYDNPTEKNYYRYTLKKDGETDLKQDFVFDDYLFNGAGVIGTGSKFIKGDQLIFTLYHIDKKYFDYLNSINGAQNANFSAFTQPYPIKSTVEEGMGVFTILTYTRKTVQLK